MICLLQIALWNAPKLLTWRLGHVTTLRNAKPWMRQCLDKQTNKQTNKKENLQYTNRISDHFLFQIALWKVPENAHMTTRPRPHLKKRNTLD